MDKVNEPVNWSALAGRAFEEKLAEIAIKKERKTMADVVERLRKSLREKESESFQRGYGAGTEWAKNKADALQLKRLHDWRAEIQTGQRVPLSEFGFFVPNEPRVMSLLVARKACGNSLLGYGAARAFWDSALEKGLHSHMDRDFLRGFVEAAADLWAEVQDQL